MSPTRPSTLVAAALVAFGTGLLLVALIDAAANRLLLVPWGAALAMVLVAVSVLVWTLLARPRLLRRPGHPPLDPIVAARTAALAMAASRTGAAVAGFYAGVALALVPSLDTEAGRSSAGASATSAVAGVVLAAVSYWLEGMCRLPGDDDGAEPSTNGGGAPENGRSGPEPARRAPARPARREPPGLEPPDGQAR